MFTKPYTDLDAYWVGFLRADAHIVRGSSGYKTIQFDLKDIEPLEAFKTYVGAKNKIAVEERITNFGYRTAYRFQSALPAYKLDNLGLKSEFELDPWFYSSKHFWRGMIDGDGSLSWLDYTYPQFYLLGTLYDITKFSNWIESVISERRTVTTVGEIYRIHFAGSRAAYLLKLLYENEYSALPRKQKLAYEYMRWESKHGSAWKPK